MISKTGRYKVFPIVGSVLVAGAAWLLSTLDVTTPVVVLCLYVFGLGVGIGFLMQTLVLAVRNDFPTANVGTATSANDFFREIGATLDSAVVGTPWSRGSAIWRRCSPSAWCWRSCCRRRSSPPPTRPGTYLIRNSAFSPGSSRARRRATCDTLLGVCYGRAGESVSMEPQSGGWPQQFPPPAEGISVPAPPNRGGGGRAIAIVAAIVGLVVGAGLTGGAWLLFGDGGGSIGGSSAAVSAPARLGDYYRFSDLPKVRERDGQSGDMKSLVDRQARWDRESSNRLSASRDGAGAVVQRYANEGLDSMFELEVVRSPSPSPQYVSYSDAKDLGLDKPLDEMLEFGSVSCVVRNEPSAETRVDSCQRTSGDLTVTVTKVGGDLGEKPEAVAELVNEAWSQVG